MRVEYGSILKMPGLFGKKPMLITYEPIAYEQIYRAEGVWPHRMGMETFDHYRHTIRPDIFEKTGGLLSEQGEKWAYARSIASPVLMKPANVNAYVPTVDQIAIDFVERIGKIRDNTTMEVASNFDYEMRKWALESIFFVSLDHRLNIVKGETTENRSTEIIKAVDDFINLTFALEVLPSIWRYFPIPKYTQLMKSFDNMTNIAMHYIEQAIARSNAKDANNSNREQSVLEKLLKVDKQVGVVMALDMMLAGVDTVIIYIHFLEVVRDFSLLLCKFWILIEFYSFLWNFLHFSTIFSIFT